MRVTPAGLDRQRGAEAAVRPSVASRRPFGRGGVRPRPMPTPRIHCAPSQALAGGRTPGRQGVAVATLHQAAGTPAVNVTPRRPAEGEIDPALGPCWPATGTPGPSPSGSVRPSATLRLVRYSKPSQVRATTSAFDVASASSSSTRLRSLVHGAARGFLRVLYLLLRGKPRRCPEKRRGRH